MRMDNFMRYTSLTKAGHRSDWIRRRHRRAEPKSALEAYLDTSALIAFLDRSDSYHLTFNGLFSAPPPLVTSALVSAEGHGWFLRRYDRHRATEFLAFIGSLPALTLQAFDQFELSKVR